MSIDALKKIKNKLKVLALSGTLTFVLIVGCNTNKNNKENNNDNYKIFKEYSEITEVDNFVVIKVFENNYKIVGVYKTFEEAKKNISELNDKSNLPLAIIISMDVCLLSYAGYTMCKVSENKKNEKKLTKNTHNN